MASSSRASWIGSACALLAGLAFGLMAFGVHLAEGTVPPGELAFLRGLFGSLVLLPVVRPHLHRAFRRDAGLLWFRGLSGASAMLCFFWNLQHTSVGTARTLALLAMVLLVVSAWLLFGERLSPKEVGAIACVLLGALALYGPGATTPSAVVTAVGLSNAVLTCAAFLALRRAAQRYPPQLVVWCFCTCVLPAAPLVPGPAWSWPSSRPELLCAGGVAVLGLAAQLCLTQAFRRLRASIAGGLRLSSLLWAVGCEMLFLGAFPGAGDWLAYGLVLGGVLLLQLWHVPAAEPGRLPRDEQQLPGRGQPPSGPVGP